jgi:hypothetical protein
LVDDFAVESQGFANALVQSAAFTAATVALPLVSGVGSNVGSGVLGVWNILVSFGTMTNTARYRNRNEEHRRLFADQKLKNVMKYVFSLVPRDQRVRYGANVNPFVVIIAALVQKFVKYACYYNQEEGAIQMFQNSFQEFQNSTHDRTSIIRFMRELAQVYIPVTFHVNSYLQEALVEIYKALDEMLTLTSQSPSQGSDGAEKVFNLLLEFQSDLKGTIERGNVKYGFIKDHAWHQTPLPVTLKYLLGPLICKRTIAAKTLFLLRNVKALDTDAIAHKRLSRPIRDLTELHYATSESHIASLTFLSGFMTFSFSIVYSIFRLIQAIQDYVWVQVVLDAAGWASLGTLLGSTIACFHFLRKMKHLVRLDRALGVMKSDPRVRRVRFVARTQQVFVLVRLFAGICATVAIPWTISVTSFGTFFDISRDLPAYIGLASVACAVAAGLLFLVVEFRVRYSVDPELGRAVCAPFAESIGRIHAAFARTEADVHVDAPQKVAAEDWEYTARQFLHEFRFDTVFAADRFGTVLQHLHSGNKDHNE